MKQLQSHTSRSAFRVHSATKFVLIAAAVAMLCINLRVLSSGHINGGIWTSHGFPVWAFESGPVLPGGALPHTEPGWIVFQTSARAFCINASGLLGDLLLSALVLIAAGAVTELVARNRSLHASQATPMA
jgi:hypothetical protein